MAPAGRGAKLGRTRGGHDESQRIDSLPDFRLFSVFSIVPGGLLMLLAGIGLLGERFAARSVVQHRIGPTHA